MPDPVVDQLRFTRAEWLRGLRGVTEEEGLRRFGPINSIGWIVGHLAWHEQRYWLTRVDGTVLRPELNELTASGGPPSTPSLRAMRSAWREVTAAVDPWLDDL
ncbi:MAG TPA: DinB family protein, partial [Chloroflexota bacterium]|nr:DinB family protein [Chloroflexota bacterium]